MTPEPGPPRGARLRLFLALDLPEAVREELCARQESLPGARWVRPEQLHLTLRFLGGVAEAELPALLERLARADAAPAFPLTVRGVGAFPERPSRRQPALVLWAGADPTAGPAALKVAIDARLGPDPESEGRGFHPHVTLARFKEDPGPALAAYLARHAGLALPAFPVRAFHLYVSETRPDGSLYTRLASFPLPPGPAPGAGPA